MHFAFFGVPLHPSPCKLTCGEDTCWAEGCKYGASLLLLETQFGCFGS